MCCARSLGDLRYQATGLRRELKRSVWQLALFNDVVMYITVYSSDSFQKGVLWARVFLGVCDVHVFPTGIVKHRLTAFLPHSFQLCTCLPYSGQMFRLHPSVSSQLQKTDKTGEQKQENKQRKILGEVWVSVRAFFFWFFSLFCFLEVLLFFFWFLYFVVFVVWVSLQQMSRV